MKIPKAVRQQVWIQHFGKVFKHKCWIRWCTNEINVFQFHCGHDIPDSKGGSISLENLFPICANCNLSMSDKYTIKQWNKLHSPFKSSLCCFKLKD
jgi:5-methylcytosine-specific restriction endonuclease McrA